MKVPFLNKTIELLNIASILHNKEIKILLPAIAYNYEPKVAYEYGVCISKVIFNYNKTLRNLSEECIINSISCECKKDKKLKSFINVHYNHVFAGDLDIIENKDIKTIMRKGAKFHETPYINSKTILTTINKAFEDLTIKWATVCKIDTVNFRTMVNKG